MNGNTFWKVCAALDNPTRIEILRLLIESKDYPCVSEIADELDISIPVASLYLKQLREVHLISCKRTDKRMYYRAFPEGDVGETVIGVFKEFFRTSPSQERIEELLKYVQALSHPRRSLFIGYFNDHPGADILSFCRKADVPLTTASRIFNQLGHAHIVDLTFKVVPPPANPERMLFRLTIDKPHF